MGVTPARGAAMPLKKPVGPSCKAPGEAGREKAGKGQWRAREGCTQAVCARRSSTGRGGEASERRGQGRPQPKGTHAPFSSIKKKGWGETAASLPALRLTCSRIFRAQSTMPVYLGAWPGMFSISWMRTWKRGGRGTGVTKKEAGRPRRRTQKRRDEPGEAPEARARPGRATPRSLAASRLPRHGAAAGEQGRGERAKREEKRSGKEGKRTATAALPSRPSGCPCALVRRADDDAWPPARLPFWKRGARRARRAGRGAGLP